MVKVTVNGTTIADSNETIVVENNHYFPPSSVKKPLLSDSKTRCVPAILFVTVLISILRAADTQHCVPVERVSPGRSDLPYRR
jgi:hypothetical protein